MNNTNVNTMISDTNGTVLKHVTVNGNTVTEEWMSDNAHTIYVHKTFTEFLGEAIPDE